MEISEPRVRKYMNAKRSVVYIWKYKVSTPELQKACIKERIHRYNFSAVSIIEEIRMEGC